MKRKTLMVGLLLLVSLFTGCSAIKIPEATGGSRSDGIVEMSFDYSVFESPKVQWDNVLAEATERCKGWGYRNAKRFGGSEGKCQNYDPQYGCMRSLITIKYQCLG